MHSKLLAGLIGLVSAVIVAAGVAGTAGAATHPNASVGVTTSDHLAGYQLNGNSGTRYRDIRYSVSVPDENPAVPADAVAVGVALQHEVSDGGFTAALALVWDDPASSCGSDSWVLEAGTGTVGPSPEPLPVSSLHPLTFLGHDVCVWGGTSQYLEIFYRPSSRVVHFISGPSVSNSNVLEEDHIGYHNFYSGGTGVTTTNGFGAASLTSGSLAAFSSGRVTQYNGHKRGFRYPNLLTYVGTETGGAPSVLNPVTLQPSAFSTGSAFAITAS
jgi:hypothetical protein